MIDKNEFNSIEYIFTEENGIFYFQRIGSVKLVKKKGIIRTGSNFVYQDDYAAIPINDYPDAIYDKEQDKLYFQKLSNITGIFNGIGELYREATEQEVEDFLANDFIDLGTEFGVEKVKTPNRKRITLARERLAQFSDKERKLIFEYIAKYCPGIEKNGKKFKINSDDELKLLLYGIDERYYTTQIGNEKRMANSVIKM